MGLFSKNKNEIYERNTRIAELETKIEALEQTVTKLQNENAELRAQLNNVMSTNEALVTENNALGSSIRSNRSSMAFDEEGESDDEDDSAGRRNEDNYYERLAREKYALELKRLKLFSMKWQTYFHDANLLEKQRLINILTDLLKDSQSVDFVINAKARVDELYSVVGEPIDAENAVKDYFDQEETGFNIDDAINPKDELDLEQLCKELGVFEG